jgi:hypothetical protein
LPKRPARPPVRVRRTRKLNTEKRLCTKALWEGSLTPKRRCVTTAACGGERNRRRRRLPQTSFCVKPLRGHRHADYIDSNESLFRYDNFDVANSTHNVNANVAIMPLEYKIDHGVVERQIPHKDAIQKHRQRRPPKTYFVLGCIER